VKISKTALIIVIAFFLVTSFIAVLFTTSFFAPPSQSTTIRVGYLTADLHHIAYFVAKNKTVGGGQSIFEKYGVNVTDAVQGGYSSGGTEMDAFAAGEVDIGFMGAPPAILKHLNGGVNTTVLAQVNDIGSALIVETSINSASDLKGKTLAVPSRSSIQYFLLLNYLEQNNISISEINVIEVSPGLMKLKMQAPEPIDGFIAWEPFPSDAAISGIGKILATSSDIWPRHLDCVIVADKTFAAKYPTLVVNFLKAHIEATNWINNAKLNTSSPIYELLFQIGVDFTQRNSSVVQEALSRVDYKYNVDLAFFSTFTTYTEKLIQYRIVTSANLQVRGYNDIYDFAERYVDESYLEQARSG
jgi:NitT/TauT family transport system substrate-binding protein